MLAIAKTIGQAELDLGSEQSLHVRLAMGAGQKEWIICGQPLAIQAEGAGQGFDARL